MRRGRCPRHRGLLATFGVLIGLPVLLSACGGGSGTTTVTYVAVAGGAITLGTSAVPTGCNPHTPAGDTSGTHTLLGAVLPSPFFVNQAGVPTGNSDLAPSAELVDPKPETIVYSLNPKAVWSDGVPITADDFKYAWQLQGGDPALPTTDVASVAGYRDIASVTGSNGGHTVTVVFKRTFADWKMLFNDLLPAHVMQKAGWDPSCPTVSKTVDLSGGPFEIGSVTSQAVTLVRNPRWWGTPANARSITVRFASSAQELAQWLRSGYVQVADPRSPTRQFLTEVSGLPGVQSEVDTSASLLQLDMASGPTSPLSSDLPRRRGAQHEPPESLEPASGLGFSGAGSR